MVMKSFRLSLAAAVLAFAPLLHAANRATDYELAGPIELMHLGKVEHAFRAVDHLLLWYPHDERVAKLKADLTEMAKRQLGASAASPGGTLPAAPIVKLPAFPGHQAEAGKNFATTIAGIAMVWIAPGTFRMSATIGSDDDTVVTLTRGYWLGRTEITQEQWQVLMSHVPVPSLFRGSERPVERIAWVSAMEFCRKLTEQEGAAGRLPKGYEYTLPTEAQWEYACRAGTTGAYSGDLDQVAWYAVTSEAQTHPVGQKAPNAWGLYDMHGNVAEWCADGYAGYSGGHVSDPWNDFTWPSAALSRIARGGAWNSEAGLCRSAWRGWSPLNTTAATIGFRLALAPERSSAPADK